MALRIIKQGTAKASSVQQFLFSENTRDLGSSAEQKWPDFNAIPVVAPLKDPELPEPSKPAVDLAHLEKTAYENGFLQGEKAGMEIAGQKTEAIMRRYADSILELGTLRSSLYAQVERVVVNWPSRLQRRSCTVRFRWTKTSFKRWYVWRSAMLPKN